MREFEPGQLVGAEDVRRIASDFRHKFRDPAKGRGRPTWAHLYDGDRVGVGVLDGPVFLGSDPLYVYLEARREMWISDGRRAREYLRSLATQFVDAYVFPPEMTWCVVYGVDGDWMPPRYVIVTGAERHRLLTT